MITRGELLTMAFLRSLSRSLALRTAAADHRTNSHTRFFTTINDSTCTSQKLKGKVALITGGASGLGKETAAEFTRQGARVVIADSDGKRGAEAARELGPTAGFVRCDVREEADVAAAVEETVARHGRLDVMHNNAGVVGPITPASISEVDLKEVERVMSVNVLGVISGVKHASRFMIPAQSGCILCTSSIAGVMGGLGPHAYTLSKFTIPGIVRSAASELSHHGVRINCISPSAVATPLTVDYFRKIFPGATTDQIRSMISGVGEFKGHECEERDVAKAALFLASDDGRYISGHNLIVDGGTTSFKIRGVPFPSSSSSSS